MLSTAASCDLLFCIDIVTIDKSTFPYLTTHCFLFNIVSPLFAGSSTPGLSRRSVPDTLDDIRSGRTALTDLPPIQVIIGDVNEEVR